MRAVVLRFVQQLQDEIVQRGDDGAEGHVALQLVELAGDEIAVLLRDRSRASACTSEVLPMPAGPDSTIISAEPATARLNPASTA